MLAMHVHALMHHGMQLASIVYSHDACSWGRHARWVREMQVHTCKYTPNLYNAFVCEYYSRALHVVHGCKQCMMIHSNA